MTDDHPREGDGRWSQVTQTHYDPDGGRELTTTIVLAISEAEGVALTEVRSPPLYDAVDVTAIENALFGSNGSGRSQGRVSTVEFRYTEYLVTVRSDGWVQVSRPSDPADS